MNRLTRKATEVCPACGGKRQANVCRGCMNSGRVTPRRAARLRLRSQARESGITLAELRHHAPSGPSEKALKRAQRREAVA